MQFDLKKFIAAGREPYRADFACDLSAWSFAGARIPEPVKALFCAEPAADGAHLTLRAKALVHGECARCLDPITRAEEINAEWDVKLSDLDDPDFELPLDEKGLLEVDTWLGQEFMLSIPPVLLCTESCAGLCPECGKKRAECTCLKAQPAAAPADARFAILKSLLNG